VKYSDHELPKKKSEVLTTGNNVSSIIAIISKDKLGTLLVGFKGSNRITKSWLMFCIYRHR
jgi:hypothetical protein